jgi:D-alanyl-lipoteichoic acid acyltransferase DltB (MBOAT superfamily)
MENFNQPYLSANITEFWRRWHISLSTWLRDYLYIPLGGNRAGTFNTYKNLMITMLLGGFWHGAAWTFVVWGGLHGLYLIGNRLLSQFSRTGMETDSPPLWSARRIVGILITFHLVLVTWVFFRAPGFGNAIHMLQKAFSFDHLETLPGVLPAIIIPWLFVLLIDIPQFVTRNHTFFLEWPRWTRDAAVAVMLFLILLAFGTHAPFIYFQF